MASRYGHGWVSQYGAEPQGIAGAEWRSTLAGLTADQVRAGFDADKRRGDGWPPSSTAFRAMCCGIPSIAHVRAEISRPERSRFTRQVWQNLDHYRFSRADQREADRMLAEAYELARDFVMAGGTLPLEPAGEIEHVKPKRTPAKPETVRKNLDAMASFLSPGASA